jgi:GntR family transcriptional regulator
MITVTPVSAMSETFLPFRLELKAGQPVFEQLVYAVRKAVVAGLLRPGMRFPSVRRVSQELRIHPNTAQKALAVLVQEGLLEVHPGIGTVVAANPPPSAARAGATEEEVERLVVQARRQGLTLDELRRLVERQWRRLSGD